MDGEAAVNIARSQKPGLVLMDIMMPKMDGYTACHEIKAGQATKGIPIIMLTGLGQELNKKFANRVGAAGYITKPFSTDELLRQVKRVLGE